MHFSDIIPQVLNNFRTLSWISEIWRGPLTKVRLTEKNLQCTRKRLCVSEFVLNIQYIYALNTQNFPYFHQWTWLFIHLFNTCIATFFVINMHNLTIFFPAYPPSALYSPLACLWQLFCKKGYRFSRHSPNCQQGEFGEWHPGAGGREKLLTLF